LDLGGSCRLFVIPPPIGNLDSSWLNLWLTRDQQGRHHFEKKDYVNAAQKFDNPLWCGLAFARGGDYESAFNSFALSNSAEGWYNQGNALDHRGRYREAERAYQKALSMRHPWYEAKENLKLVESLIPKAKDKAKDEEQEISPNLPPDQMKFDERKKKGTKAQIQQFDPKKMADIWMRNIQTTPADFLRRHFAIQAAQESRHEACALCDICHVSGDSNCSAIAGHSSHSSTSP
jgi:Ca-activated chloride channel family protein